MRKKIPTGAVFHKAYTDRKGNLCHTHVWYVKYYDRSKPIVLSAETEDYDEALTFLRQKMAQASRLAEFTVQPRASTNGPTVRLAPRVLPQA